MEAGHLYNGRLNLLNWKGCGDLWRHVGRNADRRPPTGFRTVGVPGILISLDIQGAPGVAHNRLDDLVRGYVGDRWDQDPDQEFDPIFILDKEESGLMQIVAEGYQSWVYDHASFGWVEFSNKGEAEDWLKQA